MPILRDAIKNNDEELIHFLLYSGEEINDFNIDFLSTHDKGESLYYAAKYGLVDAVKRLLAHGAPTEVGWFFNRHYQAAINCLANVVGDTPLYIAAKNGHTKVV